MMDGSVRSDLGPAVRLRCACGWETSGTEAAVIAAAEEHGAVVHNMRPTRDQILAMLVPLEAETPAERRAEGD
jgi:hypothetical protein